MLDLGQELELPVSRTPSRLCARSLILPSLSKTTLGSGLSAPGTILLNNKEEKCQGGLLNFSPNFWSGNLELHQDFHVSNVTFSDLQTSPPKRFSLISTQHLVTTSGPVKLPSFTCSTLKLENQKLRKISDEVISR